MCNCGQGAIPLKITTYMETDSVNSTEGMQRAILRQRSLLSITHSDRPFQCESVLCVHACVVLASFPGSCAGEKEREPGTHSLRIRQVPLVTCILLRYTKIMVNFCLPAEGRTA